jgi:hypothetical protein
MSAAASAAGCCCAAAVEVDAERSAVKNEGSNSRVFSSVRGTFSASRFYVLFRNLSESWGSKGIAAHTYLLCLGIVCFALRIGKPALKFSLSFLLLCLVEYSFAFLFIFYCLWLESVRAGHDRGSGEGRIPTVSAQAQYQSCPALVPLFSLFFVLLHVGLPCSVTAFLSISICLGRQCPPLLSRRE